MSGNPLPSKASAKFLDYVGLGLILMVIEVFGARWFEGQTISRGQWITGGFLMLAGAIFVAVGTWWDKVNPPPAGRFAPSFDGLVHHAATWMVVAAVIVFGVPITIGLMSSPVAPISAPTPVQSPTPASGPANPKYSQSDRDRINEALFKLHRLFQDRIRVSAATIEGLLQQYTDNGQWPSGSYASAIEVLTKSMSDIDSETKDIQEVLRDNSYYEADLKPLVYPDGGRDAIRGELQYFIQSIKTLAEIYPKMDTKINGIIYYPAMHLDNHLKTYLEFISKTRQLIDDKQRELRGQQ